MSNPNTPQPQPKINHHPAVWDLVMDDMLDRDANGTTKYGTRLQPHNGRDFLVDAYQESLDLVVYLRGKIHEEQSGLTIIFPRLRFVDGDALYTQLNKIEEEVEEVREAFFSPSYENLAGEILDTMQACATALMILGEHRGVNIDTAVKQCIEKNKNRGYESEKETGD